MDETIDRLRRVNQRIHRRAKREQIDAECTLLQSLRHTYAAWEQHVVTEAINQLQQGNRFPECAPMAQVIAQIDAAIERDLEACRETLRRFNARYERYAIYERIKKTGWGFDHN